MSESTNRITSAPGLSLQSLLQNTKPLALLKLINPATMNVIQALDPDIALNNRLSELVLGLIDPLDALSNAELRDKIIHILPLPKARELGDRLGIDNSQNLYDDICAAASNSSSFPILKSFFGVVDERRAPRNSTHNIKRVAAQYDLFDHQRVAAKRVMHKLISDPHKVILHMPTGSGKTRTAMHIVAEHIKQNEPTVVCWLAQSVELLEQAADEFEKAWSFLGNREVSLIRFWGSRKVDVLDVKDGVIVAGLAKMAALDNRDSTTFLRLADRTSLTIIDEAHQAIAPTYSNVLDALHTKRPSNALLGLTATPGRTWSNIEEDKKLSDYFDGHKVILEVEGYSDPVTFLIDQEYLARPNFRTLNSNAEVVMTSKDVAELSSTIVDVPESILNRLGDDTQRNIRILAEIECLLMRHRRVIVFSPSVENARMLEAILSLRGHEASVITGQSRPDKREQVIRRFRGSTDKPMVIINFGVLTTGFDAPSISAAIIARPTRSLVLYSQMVGRATRGLKAGGNAEAEIVTVVDPHLPGFGSVADAFKNWEDVWNEQHDR